MDINNILEVLNTQDLTNTDLTPTLIRDGATAVWNIAKVSVEPTKDGDSQNIVVELKLAAPVMGNKGVELQSYTHIHRISLKPVDKDGNSRVEGIKRDCTAFKLAVTGSKAGTFMPVEQYIGRQVTTKMVISKDKTGQYGDQNRIGQWVPPAGTKVN